MSSFGIDSNDMMHSSATVANSLVPATAKTATTTSTTGTAATNSGSTQDISSNDFLTLLVTEMKNQDPTQPTDPNAYIQQLTEVNSLQQLIAINQDLSGLNTGSGASGSSTSTSATAPVSN